MQNKGYTIPELIIVIVLVGIFSMFAISKASYAFQDNNEISENTKEMILIKTSTAYGNSILEELKLNDIYINGKDLVEAGYLIDDDNTYSSVKIKLSYNEQANSVNVEILK